MRKLTALIIPIFCLTWSASFAADGVVDFRSMPDVAVHSGLKTDAPVHSRMKADAPVNSSLKTDPPGSSLKTDPMLQSEPEPSEEKWVLAIIGDVWHRPAWLDRHLVGPLRGDGWKADVIVDYDVPWDDFENYDLIILSRYGQEDVGYYRNRDRNPPNTPRELWLTKEQSLRFVEYVEGGGRMLLFHDGFGHYPCDFGPAIVARSCFITHPPIVEITVSTTDRMPEITEGVESPFVMADEEYEVTMDESETNVFLESHSPEHGRSPQGWAHTFGDGKVVVLIPGHLTATIEHPMINRLIRNSLDWLLE